MIELPTSKSLGVVCFAKSSLKFYPWNRIGKNIKKRSPATLGMKIIHSSKESIDCDWNNEEDLDTRPQKCPIRLEIAIQERKHVHRIES
jgi:hypothetical protein